ncbi:ATP-grasp domain-containing protein [Spirochaeta cellobiosiphila]|uniref:ATP-grasp domain-containing protein n=1 Tax=Spirochaeta cellobiosiphila TaxID=504483 RepID=UPI0004289D9B|nr:ATP-grasp domain-containing protein [Spirochaeta cellobiosiphila]
MILLVLGAGSMQAPIYDIARSKGYKTIAFDGNQNAVCKDKADEFYTIDISDRDASLLKARELHRLHALDGVFTAGTDFSTTVAWIAEDLDLPGIPFEVALGAKDKGIMRKILKKNGLNVPEYRIVYSPNDRVDIPFPLVVKPVDNMGARGVILVNSDEELSQGISEALVFSASGQVIVEEYMDGPEFSLDSLIYEGHFLPCGLADRDIQFPPYFIEMGHNFPSHANEAVQKELWTALHQAALALGISRGAAKGDLKWYKGKAYIGEIAARLSGGYMSGWTYPYHSGVSPTEVAMDLALGKNPEEPQADSYQSIQERAIISLPGTVIDYIGLDEITKDHLYMDHFIQKPVGSDVHFPVNNVQKCINFIFRCADVRSAKELASRVVPRLDTDNDLTYEYLLGSKRPLHPNYPLSLSLCVEKEDAFLQFIPYYMKPEGRLDWQGRSLSESLEQLSRITGLPQKVGAVLPVGFSQSVLRGSVQGGLWFIDRWKKRR